MGQFFTKMREALSGFMDGSEARILMLGLDAAGKTTILYKVKLNEQITTIPTIGFNVETVTPVKGVTFTMWDVGGQEKLRTLWRHYYQNTQGLLFIVDSADSARMSEASEELFNIIKAPEMEPGVPVVVVANKQDLPGALNTSQIVDKLRLHDMRDRKWFIQGACATNGDGIYEAMGEMATLVKEFKKR